LRCRIRGREVGREKKAEGGDQKNPLLMAEQGSSSKAANKRGGVICTQGWGERGGDKKSGRKTKRESGDCAQEKGKKFHKRKKLKNGGREVRLKL